jgi:hypothetical protein
MRAARHFRMTAENAPSLVSHDTRALMTVPISDSLIKTSFMPIKGSARSCFIVSARPALPPLFV